MLKWPIMPICSLVFGMEKSKGTKHMIELASQAGLIVKVFYF
jgi:hypothetical protein